jgi:hypothetical protein
MAPNLIIDDGMRKEALATGAAPRRQQQIIL